MLYKLINVAPIVAGRDRLEVRTLRCGRNNPGSNPGHGTFYNYFFFVCFH